MLPLFLLVSLGFCAAHCPHMMGVKIETSGPSAPASLPEDDKGWDYDETAAPGMLPSERYIQTTYIFKSPNEQERHFASRVRTILNQVKETLAKQTRLTIDNENIECHKPTDHFRCEEFPVTGAFNYLIIEDAKNGARVYELERKHNEKSDGMIEAALLDALNRHYPLPLIPYASKEAKNEVGFIRQLSNEEFLKLSQKEKKKPNFELFSPIELNFIESAVLETRSGQNLDDDVGNLVEVSNKEEFDSILEKNQFVFVLFWNHNDMTSLHTFNLWARTSKLQHKTEDTVLAHVKCHVNEDFCQGLRSADFRTVVAYRDGKNIGTTDSIGDEKYYSEWIELLKNGPLFLLQDKEALDTARKGTILGSDRPAITIGVFKDREDPAYKHFVIAAEKLFGRFFLAYYLDEQAKEPTISTYRSAEKQKRTRYSGRFDPATIMAFIYSSSVPSVIDISNGFTTDAVLRQKRAVLVHVSHTADVDSSFLKAATREDARSEFIFTKLQVSTKAHQEALEELKLELDTTKPTIILFNKDRVSRVDTTSDADQLLRTLKKKLTQEANRRGRYVLKESLQDQLSTKEAHPLRYLQKGQVDRLFGEQNSLILPDHTLFLTANPFATRHPHHGGDATAGTGGCPFMHGGGASGAAHTEL